jgi:hypothetical protein
MFESQILWKCSSIDALRMCVYSFKFFLKLLNIYSNRVSRLPQRYSANYICVDVHILP